MSKNIPTKVNNYNVYNEGEKLLGVGDARFPGSGNKPLKQEGTWLRTLWKDTRNHT